MYQLACAPFSALYRHLLESEAAEAKARHHRIIHKTTMRYQARSHDNLLRAASLYCTPLCSHFSTVPNHAPLCDCILYGCTPIYAPGQVTTAHWYTTKPARSTLQRGAHAKHDVGDLRVTHTGTVISAGIIIS